MPKEASKPSVHKRASPSPSTGDLFASSVGNEPRTLAELNEDMAAAGPMVEGGTRAVFGEGPIGAALAFVGEQPGDQEDLEGHPFVGPAGKLLDKALREAGIDRAQSYVTNAVKHFKFQQRGKRRLHEKPTMGEVKHYRWWLMKELDFVHPHLVVALGGTAAYALAGAPVVIGRSRGPAEFGTRAGFITVHPSSILRIRDRHEKETAYADFVHDLKSARKLAARHA
ncbi:UdgX family uracil-DNA binding protein [Hyphomicrobium sp. DY-1]|uniref:UdgX family uracil-DNA binding protein n=1 Tax=Hyphomicrobium sp. DY-1 TaxID=3075650 RepID=UPI0039C1B7B1